MFFRIYTLKEGRVYANADPAQLKLKDNRQQQTPQQICDSTKSEERRRLQNRIVILSITTKHWRRKVAAKRNS